jgi:hypothetical protein
MPSPGKRLLNEAATDSLTVITGAITIGKANQSNRRGWQIGNY